MHCATIMGTERHLLSKAIQFEIYIATKVFKIQSSRVIEYSQAWGIADSLVFSLDVLGERLLPSI
jgi:hypothetical protein